MSLDHRLYREDNRTLVRPAVPETPARTATHNVPMCGFYPADDYLATVNALPGAGVGLMANETATSGQLVLQFEKLTQNPPISAGQRRLLMDAWFGKAGVPTLGSVNTGAGAPILGNLVSIVGPAGIPTFGRAQWLIDHGLTEADVEALLNPPPPVRYCYVCALFPQTYKVPAVSGTPAIFLNAPGGWDSGAISAQAIYANGRAKFRVRRDQPVVIGLVSGGDPTDPRSQFVGMYFDTGSVRGFARTVGDGLNDIRQGGGVGLSNPWNFTSYDMRWGESDTHTVQLLRHEVTFTVAGRDFGPFRLPEWYFPDNVFTLGAVIFTPGAWVEGIEVRGFNIADGVLPPLMGRAGYSTPKAQSFGKLPALFGRASPWSGSIGRLPKIKARGGRELTEGYGELPLLFGKSARYAPIEFPPEAYQKYSLVYGSLPALAGSGGRGTPKNQSLGRLPKLTGASRNATRSASGFPALVALGGRKVGMSVGKLPALASYRPVNYERSHSAGIFPALTTRQFGSSGGVGSSRGTFAALQAHSYPGTRRPPVARAGASVLLPALASVSGRGVPKSQSLGRLPKLASSATGHRISNYSRGALPPLAGRTGRGTPNSLSFGALPRLSSSASAGPTTKNYSFGRFAPLAGRSGRASSASAQAFPQMVTVAHGLMNAPTLCGNSLGTFPRLYTDAFASAPGHVSMYSHLYGWEVSRNDRVFVVVMNSAGTAATAFAITRVVNETVLSAAGADTPVTLSSILTALMQSEILAGGDAPLFDQAAEVWALNLANDATSTYAGYDFNSFGQIGGSCFGARQDGVYLLEGDTDAGNPIRASVSYGAQDFGSKTKKNLSRAYVGASSTGTLYLKVTANGQKFIYSARASSPGMKQQRFDVGRGLQATYFTFELFNKNGGNFEIGSVSFMAAEFIRRI